LVLPLCGEKMAGKTESRKPVYEDVRELICARIRTGEYRVGESLPSERKLAATFNVSRNSVREAIRVLAENKIVESRQGDGNYICAGEEGAPPSSLTRAIRRQKQRLRDIFELRRILEPQIAYRAAQKITRGEVERLKALVFDQERRIAAGEEDGDVDGAFHLLLARATRNLVVLDVLRSINDILGETRASTLQSEERRRVSLRTHSLLVDALEKRDPQAARQAMEQHLLGVEQAIPGAEGVEGKKRKG
jgi:GntR family transcriptional repressor for pyruvate dehydrogenase complex